MDDQLYRIKSSLSNIQSSLKRYQCDLPSQKHQQNILTDSIMKSQNTNNHLLNNHKQVIRDQQQIDQFKNIGNLSRIQQKKFKNNSSQTNLHQKKYFNQLMINQDTYCNKNQTISKPQSCKTQYFIKGDSKEFNKDFRKASTILQSYKTQPNNNNLFNIVQQKNKKSKKHKKHKNKHSISSFTIQTKYIFNQNETKCNKIEKNKYKDKAYFIMNNSDSYYQQVGDHSAFIILTRSKNKIRSQTKHKKQKIQKKFEPYQEYYCQRLDLKSKNSKNENHKWTQNKNLSKNYYQMDMIKTKIQKNVNNIKNAQSIHASLVTNKKFVNKCKCKKKNNKNMQLTEKNSAFGQIPH